MKDEYKTKIVLTAIGSIPFMLKFTTDAMTARKIRKNERAIAKGEEFIACLENSNARLNALVEDPCMTEEEYNRVKYEEAQFLTIVELY